MAMFQLDLFPPESDWTPPRMDSLPSWAGAKKVSIDTETKDPYLTDLGPGTMRRDGHIVGVSLAFDDGPQFYLPLRHEGGDNMESEEAVWEYLRYESNKFTGEIVGMNLAYDLDWLTNYGVTFPLASFFRDIMIADPLIYEMHPGYSMDAISKRWGFAGKEEDLLKRAGKIFRLKNVKAEMYKLGARYVGPYGEYDARLPLLVLEKQQKEIDKQGLQKIFDLESQLLPVLVRMRRRGVRVSEEKLSKIKMWSLAQEAEALARIADTTGCRIEVGNVWKPDAVAPAMAAAGLKIGRTAKTDAPQIDRMLLNANVKTHPAIGALLHARKVNKLRTTFAESVQRFAVYTDGEMRIHPTFNQLAGEDESGVLRGARFGRMSCTKPNLQQQPSRDEFAAMWRDIYEPEPGCMWACCDISQQEPRWACHFAFLTKMEGAAQMVDAYNNNPATDSHSMMAEISGLARKYAKALNLGVMYGEGGAKLCKDLGLPTRMVVLYKGQKLDPDTTLAQQALHNGGKYCEVAGEEGQRILDTFNEKVPFLKALSNLCSARARTRGFITTVLGRRCRFPKDDAGNYQWAHKALNRLVQGSSADQMKKAMIEVDRAGYFLQLQIHDELDLSVKTWAEANAIAQIIADATPAVIPFKIDVECGPSWGQIEAMAA